MRHAQSEQAQMAAICELLDRGHGKPTQPISGEEGGPMAVGEIVVTFVGAPGDPAEGAGPPPLALQGESGSWP